MGVWLIKENVDIASWQYHEGEGFDPWSSPRMGRNDENGPQFIPVP
jgi:hypothetical protein